MQIQRIALLLFLVASPLFAEEPIALYLMWQRDPSTTMTIQWITSQEETQKRVEYRREGTPCWCSAVGTSKPLPQDEPYLVHSAELTNLIPNTRYEFRTEKEGDSFIFQTLPTLLTAPITFVVGGDIYHDTLENVSKTNRVAAATAPQFALLGGDLAYAASRSPNQKEEGQRWLSWLKQWNEEMVTPDGRLIPMLVAMGNHDVNGRYNQTPEQAKFFYTLFSMPGEQGYNVLDFGNYMSLLLLDSNHTHPISGDQTVWLYHTLKERENVPYTFALYHVPAYPSVRKFRGKVNQLIRTHWVPVFENQGLTAAFENHDHAYKRSYPLFKNQIDRSKGVLYMGDGGWGVNKPRKPHSASNTWFLAHSAEKRSFIHVTLERERVIFRGVDDNGTLFDQFILTR